MKPSIVSPYHGLHTPPQSPTNTPIPRLLREGASPRTLVLDHASEFHDTSLTPPRGQHGDKRRGTVSSNDAQSASLVGERTEPNRKDVKQLTPIRPVMSGRHTRKSVGSNRSPDRFVPKRGFSDLTAQKFHSNKSPQQLTSLERLLRSNKASPDAFTSRRDISSLGSGLPTARRVTSGGRISGPTSVPALHHGTRDNYERQPSIGSIWTVGGLAPLSIGINDGRGGYFGSGTNAPLYTARFSRDIQIESMNQEHHECRVATALDLDRIQRILDFNETSSPLHNIANPFQFCNPHGKTAWTGSQWTSREIPKNAQKAHQMQILPAAPFKILDAPQLRDDFYCSVLAYSSTCHTLAVGLGPLLYSWSEVSGVDVIHTSSAVPGAWITSVAFSSAAGSKCILATGRSDGLLILLSLLDRPGPRFECQHTFPVACVSWRPVPTLQPSRSPFKRGDLINAEDLLVGDESGNVYCYSVEWPDPWEVEQDSWSGAVTLVSKIAIHVQQICGLAWSKSGDVFATGGNDNLCLLFQSSQVFISANNDSPVDNIIGGSYNVRDNRISHEAAPILTFQEGAEMQKWIHSAAVKAIAFCPWHESLVATSGGSNDKCIHFFHTTSGACLATISVAAQVTSLIWSTSRREIAATFGYAQPEHPVRVAVFSWPECKQVAAIPWEGEHRALYAISYPSGPRESGLNASPYDARAFNDGCIIVAASDETVKFHEVWSSGDKTTSSGIGLLGGSDILEGLEGIDKDGDIIR